MSKKVGLVLAGGGGKGAYHIGVWKALKEFDIENNICAVSGTSIGALNAALFIQGDYELAEHVWLSMSQDKVISINPDKIVKKLTETGFRKIAGWLGMLKNHGWVTRKGLLDIISEYINLSYISSSDIISYATCCEYPALKAKYFKLNRCNEERITKVLLASSALPLIYDSVEIDGKNYIDGGIPVSDSDNVPIKPLYDEGCNIIFVIHLSRTYLIDHNNFPDAQIVEIVPQDDQGGLFKGTLDFKPQSARRRIEQGYNDAVRVLKPIYNMGLSQLKIKNTLEVMHENEIQFTSKRSKILQERVELMEEIDKLLDSEIGG